MLILILYICMWHVKIIYIACNLIEHLKHCCIETSLSQHIICLLQQYMMYTMWFIPYKSIK